MKSIQELMSLEGRVALITGGAGYIGAAFCEALAEAGASISVLDITLEKAEPVAQTVHDKFGRETQALGIDLSDEKLTRSVPERVLERFGRIDILINCAAFVGTSNLAGWTTPFLDQQSQTWRDALEVNLTSVFILTQMCHQALKKSGHGTIINVGSTYGAVGPDMRLYEGTPMGNPAAYAASKGGLLQLTRWLATVLAPDIRVNILSPGGVWRNQPEEFHQRYLDRTPLKRMAHEEDVKGTVVYLASDMSSYVTGQNIMVDGGWTVW